MLKVPIIVNHVTNKVDKYLHNFLNKNESSKLKNIVAKNILIRKEYLFQPNKPKKAALLEKSQPERNSRGQSSGKRTS
jgi:hypothetical protein